MAKIQPDEPCPCGSGKPFRDCHGPRVKTGPPPITDHLRLPVIPEPDPGTRSVFQKTTAGSVIFAGEETGLSLDCGRCGSPLVQGLRREQVASIVLQCNACGSYNDT